MSAKPHPKAGEIRDANVILEGLCLKLRDAGLTSLGPQRLKGFPDRQEVFARTAGASAFPASD